MNVSLIIIDIITFLFNLVIIICENTEIHVISLNIIGRVYQFLDKMYSHLKLIVLLLHIRLS